MTNHKATAAEGLKKWLLNICFEPAPVLIDDCQVTHCKACGKGAWVIKDIKHEKDCEVSKQLNNLEILRRYK